MFLIVLGIVLGYFAIGAVYARSQVARLYAVAKEHWRYEDMTRDSVGVMIAWRVAFWPVGVLLDVFRGPLRTWFMAPVTDRKERAKQLREDAKAWERTARDRNATAEERRMAGELVTILRKQAEEVDL